MMMMVMMDEFASHNIIHDRLTGKKISRNNNGDVWNMTRVIYTESNDRASDK